MMNWKCKEFKITKYENEADYRNNKISSVESHHGNLITDHGLFAMWVLATGTSDTIEATMGSNYPLGSGVKVKPFTTQSVIAIGKGNVAATNSDTNLLSTIGTLPVTSIDIIAPSTTSPNASMKLKAEAGVDDANDEWNEWGIFDVNNGIMFNHKVESMGSKVQGSIWTVEVVIDLIRSN